MLYINYYPVMNLTYFTARSYAYAVNCDIVVERKNQRTNGQVNAHKIGQGHL